MNAAAPLNVECADGYSGCAGVPVGAFVNAYLGLGENEQALVWMESAYDEQSNILQFLKMHPFFDPMRSDPRLKTYSTAPDWTKAISTPRN